MCLYVCVCVHVFMRVCVSVCEGGVAVGVCLRNTRPIFVMHDLKLKSLDKSSNGN